MTRFRGTMLWLAVNGCGVAAYLYFSSLVWPPPELRGTVDEIGPGTPFIWALSALPTLVLCLLINLVMVAVTLWGQRRPGAWQPTRLAWVIPVIWAAACGFDRTHY